MTTEALRESPVTLNQGNQVTEPALVQPTGLDTALAPFIDMALANYRHAETIVQARLYNF